MVVMRMVAAIMRIHSVEMVVMTNPAAVLMHHPVIVLPMPPAAVMVLRLVNLDANSAPANIDVRMSLLAHGG